MPHKLRLYDIEDAEAFCIMCVKRSGAKVGPQQYDDIVQDALVLLLVMAKNYVAQMEGYDKPGKFSGYAVKFLPRQIAREWHKQQENHLYRKQEDGTRRWEVMKTAESYDQLMHENRQERQGFNEHRIRGINEMVAVPRETSHEDR